MTSPDSVGDLVRQGARSAPDRVAVKTRDGEARTYAELDRRTERLANGLLGTGLSSGDRVATWMEDSVAYVELYLAAAKAGLVVVPVNARFVAAEADHLLADSGARALVVTGEPAGLVEQLAEPPPHVLGAGELEALVERGSERPLEAPATDALYVLGYTSGTTGAPKGAMLTHRSVLAIARQNARSYRLPDASVCALTGSMSFVAVVPAHILTHFAVAGTVVIMGRWDPESLLQTIAAEQATFTYLPGPVIGEFANLAAQRREDWASLRSVLHSASRAEPGKLRELGAVVGERYVEGWGMTENSGGLMTATTAEDVAAGDERAFSGVGRAVAGTEVDVRGDGDEPLPHDGETVGELCFRGPALMDGYFGRPEVTAEALRGGWFHSGDLGTIDADGHVAIADRRTDLIVSGGMNVYPSEVEECIVGLDGVSECAVVGVPHDRWGQTVVAVVVRDGGARPEAEAVVEHCRARLASYKKPTHVLFVAELPRTTSLKVRRGEVRETARRVLG